MPCFHPIEGYRSTAGMVMVKAKSTAGVKVTVPCGQCIGCRRDKARDWGTRMAHEAAMHEHNAFVTLTYSDEFLPDDGSVNKRDLQLFMKRLRKALAPQKVRYYACGEYGEKNWRAHYHLVLFGYFPDDGVLWRKTPRGHVYWRSPFLEKIWGMGHVEFGDVSAGNAEYVAGYVLKKITGQMAERHYRRAHPVTGEIVQLAREFAVMSNRPGIGTDWFNKYESDAFPSDFVVIEGKKRPVPKFYQRKLKDRFEHEGSDPNRLLPVDDLKLASDRKKQFALAHAADNTPERRAVREEIKILQQERHNRSFDRET